MSGQHRHLRRVPGRLCLNPSDFSSDYPHGGSDLGEVRVPVFMPNMVPYTVQAEEWGNMGTEMYRDKEIPIFSCILSTWNDDALATLMGGGQGTTTKRGVLLHNVFSQPAGTRISGNVIYFSPYSAEDVGLLLYRALTVVRDGGDIAFTLAEQWGMPLLFYALPDSSGRTYSMALRGEL